MRSSQLMRSFLVLLPAFLLLAVAPARAQSASDAEAPSAQAVPGTDEGITWIPFDEALEAAGENDRKILVFVYTDWCGWCRRMLDSTFTEASVQAYMTDSFATVRLDAEGDTPVKLEAQSADGAPLESVSEAQLAVALGASGFPTTVFLESDGRYITRLPSYLPAKDYYNVLRYIGEDLYKTQSFEEYVSGLSGD